jgi:hypothetical protein
MSIMMRKSIFILLIACCALWGCKKSGNSPSAASTGPSDAIHQKFTEIAGGDATNCGRLQTQESNAVSAASKCAMDAAQQKHPFYVAYDMPGMTIGVAGNSDGKLFTVQSQTGGVGLATTACPADLRVAPSGRVTCYAPGTFPMGAGVGSHGGMSMPSATGPNPHQGSQAPANPHQKQN